MTKKYSKTTTRYYYEHWNHGQLTTSYYTLNPDNEERKPCEIKIPHLVSSFINNEGAELEQRVPTGSHSWKGMER